MRDFAEQVRQDIASAVDEWLNIGYLKENDLFVIGCSTSEVIGEMIGTAGSEQAASIIFAELQKLKETHNVSLAFQCCEHLNRALVVEADTMHARQLDAVTVVPAAHAGGSMATFAYHHMAHPVVVETIHADAGMDIGETMIGMHLKRVAVPIRLEQKQVGHARLQAARTRPKLIGGERAIYQ